MSEELNKATRGSIIQIILNALSTGDKYGYEICKYVEEVTNGKLVLKQPSLYSCLKRLEEQEYISSYWEDSDIGGKRHYYSLTESGKKYIEENQDNWLSGSDLLECLPSAEKFEETFDNGYDFFDENTKKDFTDSNEMEGFVSDEEFSFNKEDEYEEDSKSPTVAAQSNLFDLAKNNARENILKNTSENLNCENKANTDNDSFFQFDLFNQNVNFIKTNKNEKEVKDIPTFKNKYENLDNNSQDIEKDIYKSNNKIAHVSAFTKKDSSKEETENIDEAKQEINEPSNNITTPPIMKQYNITSVTRFDIHNNGNVDETNLNLLNADILNNSESENDKQIDLISIEKTEITDINNKNDTIDVEGIFSDNFPNKLSENEGYFDEGNKNNLSSTESISWDFETDIDKDNALFNNSDYKSVIGQLYNNSRLDDPYEKNKFYAFKEIFPASRLSQTEQENQINQDKKVETLIQSSKESNINCDDLKNLNTLFNLQGIQIKAHNNLENSNNKKQYTDKNKLHMVSSWAISIIMILEIMFSYIVLKGRNLIYPKQSIIYFLSLAFILSFCLISTLENYFDRFRLVIIKKNFNKSFLIRLFIFIILIVIIFASNLFCGMTSLMQVEYLSYWLLPTILSTNILLYLLVYKVLLQSKNFNS